jgi:hypothetical protein
LLKGKSIAERPIFWHYPHYSPQGGGPGGAIRFGDWKLIDWYETGRTELFNLKKDAEEQHDLSSKESGKVKELQARLNDWRKDVHAVMPTENPEWPAGRKSNVSR